MSDEMKELMKNMELSLPVMEQVKKDHKGEDWVGMVECPKCKGELQVSHARYNGHVHGRCKTDNCLGWME